MRLKSLKSKLLIAVSALILVSGLIITFWVTRQYSSALHEAMLGQVENEAQTLALDAADKILVNDLVALQKMLDQQKQINPAVGYILVLREGQILAHTFEKGIPEALIRANDIALGSQPRLREIVSQRGEYYLDAAWPIFAGKAGVLRLGFSEKHYRRQVTELWVEIALFTLAILLIAWVGSLWFVRRITWPLAALVEATREIDRGETNVQVAVRGQDEIATLAVSFNQMVARQEDYTRRLEEQAQELERAHTQTRAACQVVRQISALQTLEEMRLFLFDKLKDVIPCQDMVLAVCDLRSDTLYTLSPQGVEMNSNPDLVHPFLNSLENIKTTTTFPLGRFNPPIFPEAFLQSARQAIIPFQDEHIQGAAIIACPSEVPWHAEGLDWVGLILNQNAGALRRAILHEEELRGLKSRVESEAGFGGLIGKDPQMQLVYQLIQDVAGSDVTVLIQGESGTGKELVARAIHRFSPRQEKPFVVINCSAYPATLLESELFGHEKGAFTGATRQKPGRFEQADGGTVFLDEIGEIPLPAQIKLLRVLQTRRFERVGGEQTLTIDVRILAATNKNLKREVEKGNFREDLFYRLNVIPIMLPPLRERQNDIPWLALHFLRGFAAEKGKDLRDISSGAMRFLLDYAWPGNVRELENSIEHAVVLAKGSQLEAWDLPLALQQYSPGPPQTMAERELTALLDILQECGGNKKLAAQRLGVSRSTIYAILKKHKIPGSDPTTH
jgi:DNA-binding NtrC family response regulator/HAMP domain-containing protein